MAMDSMLTMAIPDNGLQLYRAKKNAHGTLRGAYAHVMHIQITWHCLYVILVPNFSTKYDRLSQQQLPFLFLFLYKFLEPLSWVIVATGLSTASVCRL